MPKNRAVFALRVGIQRYRDPSQPHRFTPACTDCSCHGCVTGFGSRARGSLSEQDKGGRRVVTPRVMPAGVQVGSARAPSRITGTALDFCVAIEARVLVTFRYDGLPRVVVPAAYGLRVDTGELVLRGYQVGGRSSSRRLPCWGLFRIERMEAARATDEPFSETPPGYRTGDQHISPIYCQL